jgi:hypothetical protein
LDVAQFAVEVGQASALSADLKAFTESEPSVRRKFAEVRDLYRDIRRIVGAGCQIVAQFLLSSESDELPENDLQKRVYDYLAKKTPLGPRSGRAHACARMGCLFAGRRPMKPNSMLSLETEASGLRSKLFFPPTQLASQRR